MKTVELQYFFDPLCGWCYASAPALAGLAARYPGQLRMMPSGLFFGSRPVASISDHAWRNDQKIQLMTGQQFSESYHRTVLLAPDGVFTSAPATLAMQALGELDAKLEAAFLHSVQIARYVDGSDTAREDNVVKVAIEIAAEHGFELSFEDLGDRLRNDVELRERTLARMKTSQARMEDLGIHGVPHLIAVIDGTPTDLNGEILYHGPERLLAALEKLVAA